MQNSEALALVAAMPQPLILVGADERIAATSPRADELLGTAGEGRHYITVLRQPLLLDAVEATFRDGRTRESGYVGNEASRETSWRVYTAPVPLNAGRGVLISFEDITHLEEAGQMRRDFVANVSHELRTPLTALIGFIETLRGAAREDPAARERFLEIMAHEAGRMNRLVKDLLSLSRLESEARLRPTERVDLVVQAAAAVTAMKRVAQEAGVELAYEHPDAAIWVPGDPDQLTQVMTNLIENAIKYGGSGRRVRVRLSINDREPALRGPAARIDVRDWGEGIDPVHIARLTERFYRVDNHRSREMGGTGLGLAIVKHIVNRHRGRLRITSELGEGAQFSVLLPKL